MGSARLQRGFQFRWNSEAGWLSSSFMSRRRLVLLLCGLCLAVVLGRTPHATSAEADLAARGLDIFVHAPRSVPPGGIVPVQLQAIGFPTVTKTRPLAGVSIEAAWDPQSLGPGRSTAPATLRTTTDPDGRAHLSVPVPAGPARDIRLLINVRSGVHQRTQTLTFSRSPSHEVQVYVADDRVVPGSQVSAWVLVRKTSTGEPAGSLPIELALLEGGVARDIVHLRTDTAGTATGRVRIPRVDAAAWTWTLQARVNASDSYQAGDASVLLRPREETPGQPRMLVTWDVPTVAPGTKASCVVRLRDAADQPVANHAIRYWIGAKGTEPPERIAEWKRSSTDIAGEWRGETLAPSPVPPIVGTDLRVVIHTKIDGRELSGERLVHVGASAPTAELLPEGGSIVAGIAQRALLRVRDGWSHPVRGSFRIEGDGLSANVSTDEHGEAEVSWQPPEEVGAFRAVGPCAQGVAATVLVRPLQPLPSLEGRTDPFSLCVPIERDARGMVRVASPVATAGTKLSVSVEGGSGKPWSVALLDRDGLVASSAWLDESAKEVELPIPSGASGLMSVSAASPSLGESGGAVHSAVLVKPAVLPSLSAKLAGGRPTPGGTVHVDAVLTDGRGAALQGTVAALVFDLHGGGSATGLRSLDTRSRLCDEVAIGPDRCREWLEGDDGIAPVRRALVGAAAANIAPLTPVLDPGAESDRILREAFRDVVKSLEGAVLESSASPDRLRDARRKDGGRWVFNPELWTLVTAAMQQPPTTPGGESFTMADLVAIDDQVQFDTVARRVTRLKLMRVLVRVRSFIQSRYMDPDEPALSDPAALLRRLVHDGELSNEDLLDPWGGTMQFVRSQGPHLPFLSVRGYSLQAPGPDGRAGTGDDVRDPFERVLRSKSPYAEAVGEDRLVDARLDMQVADATVDGWSALIESLTGTSLGLSGVGEGGGGRGAGIGLGSIGTIGHGAGRGGFGITTENVAWLPPKRTDANGRVRLEVPLGSIETTWRVVLVAVPDKGHSATAQVDVPTALDISARVEAGARWIEGDRVETRISLRNRTKSAARASLTITPGGVASLLRPTDAKQSVTIPAMGAMTVTVPVQAKVPGSASLQVLTSAPGIQPDVVNHQWDVLPRGERTSVTQVAWVDDEASISLPFAPERRKPIGGTRLILERGLSPVFSSALDALDPDRVDTPDGLVDALEVALRVHQWAVMRGGESDPLARRARRIAERARGRLVVHADAGQTKATEDVWSRIRSLPSPVDLSMFPAEQGCPPDGAPTLHVALSYLELEPPPHAGVVESCWDSFVTQATDVITRARDDVALARAILALSERSHRRAVARALAERLIKRVSLTDAGWIRLDTGSAEDRASRAIVYAALLRTAKPNERAPVAPERLAAWLLVQRDPYGGYGSPLATRSAVRAFSAQMRADSTPATVWVTVGDRREKIEIGASGTATLELGPRATSADITTSVPGIVARLERKAIRLWMQPPLQPDSPIHMDVQWPERPRAGVPSRLQVSFRHDLERMATVDARIPLPPGVTLAEPVDGVRQFQGVLAIRRTMDESTAPSVMQIPLRFGLSGVFTAPESHARLADEQSPRAIAQARPVTVGP